MLSTFKMWYMIVGHLVFDISTSNNIGISNIYAKNNRKWVLDLSKILTKLCSCLGAKCRHSVHELFQPWHEAMVLLIHYNHVKSVMHRECSSSQMHRKYFWQCYSYFWSDLYKSFDTDEIHTYHDASSCRENPCNLQKAEIRPSPAKYSVYKPTQNGYDPPRRR